MTAPTFAETAGIIGVQIRAPRGHIPRNGLSENGIERLLSVATRAAIVGRGHCRSWIHESDIGWITTCYTWAWPGPTINEHDLGGGR